MIVDGKRALAHTEKVEWIRPIEGADNIELIGVLGWVCIAKIGEFHEGDVCVYIEIDSKVPEKEWSEFLRPKHFKVKTMKLNKFGGVISQGLALPLNVFDVEIPNEIGVDVTDLLGITYSVEEDNKRKSNGPDKYKAMARRRPEIFSKNWARWMMKREWGKKVMFAFFGKKKDKKSVWPSHICSKTDVERIQNMPFLLGNGKTYVATEKIDGSSCTFAAEKNFFNKVNFYVCSRNVVFKDENQETYYDSNIYYEMYEKYGIKEKLVNMLNDLNLKNIAIQAECYGDGIQKRDYSLSNQEHKLAVFHIVTNREKYSMDKVINLCEQYNLPHVPIIDTNYHLPSTMDEIQTYVEGAPSALDGKPKEGIVFYDKETGQQYFKFVSPNFLMKYH